jgi:peroxiredoxin (alkyl hydroperoxide reductase subunit C)
MALKAGDLAPDFKIPATTGDNQADFQLSKHRGKKNVVIVFFPAAFTSVCSSELKTFQADLAKFAECDAEVVGISTDSVPAQTAFQEKLGGLSFPLGSDRWPYAKTGEAYGVFPATKHNFAPFNDRAIFVVDKQGKIAWLKIYPAAEKPDVDEVLAELKKLS